MTDVEGALWTDRMMSAARLKDHAELKKTVIAVDPAVTNNPGSEECGIVPVRLDVEGEGVVHDDLSLKASTKTWAQRVVAAYHAYEANYVVAEKNNGGDLVRDAITAVDSGIKVVLVHASKGKFARAEPVSLLYEQGKVSHPKELPELQSELTETVFDQVKKSPNRLDAMVWGLTELMVGKVKARYHVGRVI